LILRITRTLVGAALAASAALPAFAGPADRPPVVIQNMAFGAAPTGLKVGQTLLFKNDDAFEHTATAKGDFDLDLKPGQSGSVVLKHAGTIQVVCRYHPTMRLTLVVSGGAA
jgi:plastocyanin